MKKKKSKLTPSEVNRYIPDLNKGLSTEEVKNRQDAELSNACTFKSGKSYLDIFRENIFTYFNMLLFGVFIAFALAGVQISKYGFIINVIANATIGIVQEIKAKKAIAKLKLVVAPTAYVIRDGIRLSIAVEDIVADDIVEITAGQQISIDGPIIGGLVEINESLLTGESIPVNKTINENVLAGSFVISGKAYIHAAKVGDATYSAGIQAKAKTFKKVKSELMKSIYMLIKLISVCMIPIVIGLIIRGDLFPGLADAFTTGDFQNDILRKSVLEIGTAMVGMIPTGMILLSSVSLAVGIVKLSKKHTMVQDLYSIEMLARVDTICFDKTGTLSNGNMDVEKIVLLDSKKIDKIMGSFLNALPENNKTSLALIDKFGINSEYTSEQVIPFSSARKTSTVTLSDGNTYILGAPEFITTNEKILSLVSVYAGKGYRVLMLASYEGSYKETLADTNITNMALIIIKDQVRKEVRATMDWFAANDVETKIISGDNPITVSQIAKEAGVRNADKCISLEGVVDSELPRLANEYYVFGRVSPEQKALLIKELQNSGKTVAYVGDGVNDILPLKTADCSIAMAEGADAAKSVSNVVLLDSNFANLPEVVNEGRRVINNITRSSTLFLMKTFSMLLISLLTIFAVFPELPLDMESLYLTNTFIVGISSILLSVEPSVDKLQGTFKRNVFSKSLPAGIFIALTVIIAYFLCDIGVSIGILDTGTTASMIAAFYTIAAFIVLIRICLPFNNYRVVVLTTAFVFVVGLVLIAPSIALDGEKFFSEFFSSQFDSTDPSTVYTIFSGEFWTNLVDKIQANVFNIGSSIFADYGKANWLSMAIYPIFGIPIYYMLDKSCSRSKLEISIKYGEKDVY